MVHYDKNSNEIPVYLEAEIVWKTANATTADISLDNLTLFRVVKNAVNRGFDFVFQVRSQLPLA